LAKKEVPTIRAGTDAREKVMIQVRRAYEPADPADGFRVLIDRIWPRGLKKEQAAIDLWLKDVAPSTELRKWFGHDPAKWDEFRKRYAEELDRNPDAVRLLEERGRRGTITLVFAARDAEHSNAVALKGYLEAR
jgi:uncharacterized protein YeaO (DUF488 family)